jgi:site-specific recombinase XerD
MANQAGKAYETWWAAMETRQCGKRYRIYLESFLSWSGWDYEELFTKYLDAKRSNDPRDAAQLTGKVMAFYRELRNRGLSPGYSRNHIKAITSFFAENGVTLELTKAQRKEMPKRGVHNKDLFSKDEIRLILGATTLNRNKALIHLLKDSGMAVSDASDLNVGDVGRALENGDKFTTLEIHRNKTDVQAVACLGPEALDSLRDWMR